MIGEGVWQPLRNLPAQVGIQSPAWFKKAFSHLYQSSELQSEPGHRITRNFTECPLYSAFSVSFRGFFCPICKDRFALK